MSEPEYFIGPEADPDRYRIGLPVGAGSEGVLYRGSIKVGESTSLDVAIKMLHPNHRARLQQWFERWTSQIELLRSLQAPGVVPVRDGFAGPPPHQAGHANTDVNTLYLVMNWIDGLPLDEWSAGHPHVPAEERLKLLLSVAGALDLMHSGQATGGTPVIHGDVKPSNILVRPNGEAVLVDFGLVRLLPEGRVSTGVTGTPGYVAPEVREQGVYTAATDRYALGAVAYFLLTEREPERIMSNDVARNVLRDTYADQPELIEHVMAMLDHDPEMRPRVLANWCAQLRQSSLDPMYQPDRLPPIAPIRLSAPGRVTISGDDAPGKITIGLLDSEIPEKMLPVSAVSEPGKFASPAAPEPSVIAPPVPPNHRSRRVLLISAVVAALMIASAVGVLALRSNGRTAGSQTHSFNPVMLASGLVVARTWTVAGSPSVLTEQLVLTNGTNRQLTTVYDEVIPSTVASNVNQITFAPPPNSIVTADPVVRYDVSLSPGASRTAHYSVGLGVSHSSSLSALVESWQSAEGGYDAKTVSAVLTSMSVSPTSMRMTTGTKRSVTLTGEMSNGAEAPPAILRAAEWKSTDPAVAKVSDGTVTALSAGTTAVTIRAGRLITVVDIVVSKSTGGSPGGSPQTASSNSPSGSSGSTRSGTSGTSLPGSVTGLTVAPDGSGRVLVVWQCNPAGSTCSGSQTIQRFSVTVSPAPGNLPSAPVPSVGTSTYSETIGGLNNGSSYKVGVAVCSSTGCTPSAEIPNESVNPYGAPDSPNLSGSVNGTTLAWNWTPPVQTGGRPIAAYRMTLDGTVVSTSAATNYQESFGYGQTHTLSVVAINSEGVAGPAAPKQLTTSAAPQSSAPPSSQPTTHAETAGGTTHTWADYQDAGGSPGPLVSPGQTVQIACKVTGLAVADGNTWWYRIASSPWNSQYYASADAFYNNGTTSGSLQGTPFYDPAVPNC